jgi:threonine/homoserine/homoserine lactone efflux protein
MSIELWFAFVAASAVLLIIPGPTILTVISYSMAHGRRANVPLIAAVTLGDSTALVVSLLGLGALRVARCCRSRACGRCWQNVPHERG